MSEGDFAQVSCIVRRGDDPLIILWSFHGSNITLDLGILTTPIGGRGSMLVIPSVGHKHRGSYTCKASNVAGSRTQTVKLNVNGTRLGFKKAHWKYYNTCVKTILDYLTLLQSHQICYLSTLDKTLWTRARSLKFPALSRKETSHLPFPGPFMDPTSPWILESQPCQLDPWALSS